MGGPQVGKTTKARRLARSMGVTARHTDDLIGQLAWSEISREVAQWMFDPGPWLIEGVVVPRALRKWLALSPEKPADIVLVLRGAKKALNAGQSAMSKGVETVWQEVMPELVRRGVKILEL